MAVDLRSPDVGARAQGPKGPSTHRGRIGGGQTHHWALNTKGDEATQRWKMDDIFTLYSEAIPAAQRVVQWETRAAEARNNAAFSLPQRDYLEDQGEVHGVDTNLAP